MEKKMKTRYKITIIILLIVGIPVSSITTIDYFDKLSLGQFSNLSPQLQGVLDYCEEKKLGHDMNLIGLNYYNDTHYIDNNKCQWQLLENYPNTDIQCIPWHHSYIDDEVIYMNHTHTFDNSKCEWVKTFNWEKEWNTKFKPSTSSYLEKIVPRVDDFRKFASNSPDIDSIFYRFGEPVDDIGSGIHIYVYELNDLTEIWIGYTDHVWYVKHVDSNGNILETLFVENENKLELQQILDYCNDMSLELNVDQPYLQYENETHIITTDSCEWRKMHLRANVEK